MKASDFRIVACGNHFHVQYRVKLFWITTHWWNAGAPLSPHDEWFQYSYYTEKEAETDLKIYLIKQP